MVEPGPIIDVTVAAVFLALAAALCALWRHTPEPSAIPPAIAFCLLRSGELVATIAWSPDSPVVHALRVAGLVALGWLLVSLTSLVRVQVRERARAREAQGEYDRARHDYQQLVRHRIANPLAAVIGGLETLAAIDLDPRCREVLLRSTLEQAQRLGSIMLDPSRLGDEEHDLRPVPRIRPDTEP